MKKVISSLSLFLLIIMVNIRAHADLLVPDGIKSEPDSEITIKKVIVCVVIILAVLLVVLACRKKSNEEKDDKKE